MKEYQNGQWILIPADMSQFEGKIERINIALPLRLMEPASTGSQWNGTFNNFINE
ncbi:type II toxin-antitoxin system HicB family antitoxin [Xenorhabdus mauleonii]|uniref:type II toxin-antitoxin system HicB family antitoxin n=1 Tax=Xenorhabdus mauleonii TaxID=351675 RepID=UPI0011143692|nr:type II toxin-antitoxin system HicB family antitoxin [Xenorhabdus mauleonii]